MIIFVIKFLGMGIRESWNNARTEEGVCSKFIVMTLSDTVH